MSEPEMIRESGLLIGQWGKDNTIYIAGAMAAWELGYALFPKRLLEEMDGIQTRNIR
jgi:hypothetical protein